MTALRVYKLGGPALEDPGLLPALAEDIRRWDGRVALVHGGGRRVDQMLRDLGLESRFVDGRRVTSEQAMEVVEMVLSGAVNKALAAGLTAAGLPAVGLSGRDGGLISARALPGLGRAGVPAGVSPAPLQALWAAGLLPVVSPVGVAEDAGPLNVNADEAALALARGLAARSLIYLSDVDGVRVGGRTAPELDGQEAGRLIAEGVIQGGMALKVHVALEAAADIEEVVIAGAARLHGSFPGTRVGAGAPVGLRMTGART